MAATPIPRPVDEVLEVLGGRRGLSRAMASGLVSVTRHVLRAFAASPTDQAEIAAALARIRRCLALIGPEPSASPDAAVAGDLTRLAYLLEASPEPARAAGGPADPPPFRPAPVVPVAPVAPVPTPATERPVSLAARAFPDSMAARAARDWYWFVLEELNGLGTLLAFQREQGEAQAATRTERRVRVMLDTLRWDATSALRETWTFVAQRLRDAEDAWGPHLILMALEPARPRVRDWFERLPRPAQAVVEGTVIKVEEGRNEEGKASSTGDRPIGTR